MNVDVCQKCLVATGLEFSLGGWNEDVFLYVDSLRNGVIKNCCVQVKNCVYEEGVIIDELDVKYIEIVDKTCKYYLEHFLFDCNSKRENINEH